MRKPNFLDRLPKDKVLHYAIGTVCFAFLLFFGLVPAIIGTFIVGIGIEIYQKITKTGAFELMDAVAVWLGGAVIYITTI